MNRIAMVAFVLLVVALFMVDATNYCSPTICSTGQKHIACNNTGAWASACPADAAMVPITSALQIVLIKAHNKHRNFVASGSHPKHYRACRMASMQWDPEMASIAAYNVKQCAMQHDQCRNTDAFKYSGQNLAWMTFYAPANHTSMLNQAVDLWYAEIANSNMTYIKAYPNNYNGPTIGHFTVMVADKNIRLGCAASTYSITGQPYKAYLAACNYATTNMIGYPIYKNCTTPASGCTTGTNVNFPSLCNLSEVYSVNTF